MMTFAESGQEFDAMGWQAQRVKVKAYDNTERTIAGVRCLISQDAADPEAATKLRGIEQGVARVVAAGFDFPDGISFYTSSVTGFQSVAYHRTLAPDGGTARKAVVMLGTSAVDTTGMAGRDGVATAVARDNKLSYCEAVVVHELGHNLHERLAEDFFWTKDANDMPNVKLAATVSLYATTNKKEVVAEIFTGLLFGRTYERPVHDMYAAYGGAGMYPLALR